MSKLAYTTDTHNSIVSNFLLLPYSTRRKILHKLGVANYYVADGRTDVERYGKVFDRILELNKRTEFIIAILAEAQ
jgi:hypothetical protein